MRSKTVKLFRDEMLEREGQWLGTVRLARPVSFSMIAAAVGIVLLLTVVFLVSGNVTRKARLAGILMPVEGTLNVAAPQNGVVLERRVQEGQHVEAGDVLLAISLERRSMDSGIVANTSESVAQEIRKRQALVEQARQLSETRIVQQRLTARERLRGIDTELAHTDEAIRLQQTKISLEQQNIERLRPLAADGYIAEARLIDKQESHIDAMGQLQTLTRARAALLRDRSTLLGELDHLDVQLQTERNNLNTQQSSLKQDALENAARQTLVLTAPCAGTVSAIEIKRGQSIQAGQSLVTLLPAAKTGKALEAHLFAPSRTAGFVQPGQNVYVRYAAYPFQKFGMHAGRIKSISTTPFSPNELPPNLAQQLLAQSGGNEALYRIAVELDAQTIQAYGQTLPLKPGFVLEADVIQDRLKIWELIFEPLLAIREKMKVN